MNLQLSTKSHFWMGCLFGLLAKKYNCNLPGTPGKCRKAKLWKSWDIRWTIWWQGAQGILCMGQYPSCMIVIRVKFICQRIILKSMCFSFQLNHLYSFKLLLSVSCLKSLKEFY